MKKTLLIASLAIFSCAYSEAQWTFGTYDIYPGTQPSTPRGLRGCNNLLFCNADDGVHGVEPWVSDGTPSGTKLLMDINAGPTTSLPTGFTAYKGLTYFAASNGNDGMELWVTDGTTAGTHEFADINPGPGSSNPAYMTIWNNKLFFQASDGVTGLELWVTDGTAAGTVLVKDINTGTANSRPCKMMPLPNGLFFAADDGPDGYEPWISDGTAAGTRLIKDICPGSPNGIGASQPVPQTVVDGIAWYLDGPILYNNKVYFSGNSGSGSASGELWVSDGTSSGTHYVPASLTDAMGPREFAVYNGKLYFRAFNNNGNIFIQNYELWTTDGTAAGTQMVAEIGPGDLPGTPAGLTVCYDKLYFSANDSVHGIELWSSDGTAAGTKLVNDWNPGTKGSSIYTIINYDGKLYYAPTDTGVINPWVLAMCDSLGNVYTVHPNGSVPSSGSLLLTEPFMVANNSLFYTPRYDTTNFELWWITDTSVHHNPNSIKPIGTSHFMVSPNPTTGIVTVTLASNYPNAVVTIRDITGKTLSKQNVDNNTKTVTMDIGEMPAGTYLISLQHGDMIETKKLILQ
ncbi:MAG: T9SS type A sorting domain-containing protein [Bacteroidetes bacterium]|nr:T9SS type A sorting domain-containing protein [Bacteroidota bacterium]